jgi:hypothetical protein
MLNFTETRTGWAATCTDSWISGDRQLDDIRVTTQTVMQMV